LNIETDRKVLEVDALLITERLFQFRNLQISPTAHREAETAKAHRG